jgi:hypothetical protein
MRRGGAEDEADGQHDGSAAAHEGRIAFDFIRT